VLARVNPFCHQGISRSPGRLVCSRSRFEPGLPLSFGDVERGKRSAQFPRLMLDRMHVASQNDSGARDRCARVDELHEPFAFFAGPVSHDAKLEVTERSVCSVPNIAPGKTKTPPLTSFS
jgi:hypothetical protein